jgi:hypothetical protein
MADSNSTRKIAGQAQVEKYLAARERGEKVLSPRLKFTRALLSWLPSKPFPYEVRSSEITGLRVRVSPTGHKAYNLS